MINPRAIIFKNEYPYKYIDIRNVFDLDTENHLSESYPVDEYRTINVNSTRVQIFDIKPFITDLNYQESLPVAWDKLWRYMQSSEYHEWLKNQTGIDVSRLPCEASIFKYTKDCLMDAHTDLPIKVLTQVFYFNENWKEEFGGNFCVLNSKDDKDIHAKILPLLGNSVIIVRSDNSWHSVEKTVIENSRRSLVITFFKEGCKEGRWWKKDEQYEFHETYR